MNIDFVITWVDNTDQEWINEKNKFPHKDDGFDISQNIRFRDWGSLKYWFRAVEKYAPWVNKIHFVTYGHIPSFLNVNNPKLNIVRHDEFIPHKYLPTFNSHTIEWNIFRIKGLSDRFVYFNDDFFLNNKTNPSDFFSKDGLPCFQFSEVPTVFTDKYEMFFYFVFNNLHVINKNFNKKELYKAYQNKFLSRNNGTKDNIRNIAMKYLSPNYFTGFKVFHTTMPFHKNTFTEIWDKEYDLLDKTCLHKYRSIDDVNPWLALNWQLVSGQYSPINLRNISHYYSICEKELQNIISDIRKNENKIICLNDTNESTNFEELKKIINTEFEKKFCNKSSFEI